MCGRGVCLCPYAQAPRREHTAVIMYQQEQSQHFGFSRVFLKTSDHWNKRVDMGTLCREGFGGGKGDGL